MYPSVSDYNDAIQPKFVRLELLLRWKGMPKSGPARFMPEADVLVLWAKQRPPPQWPTKCSREGCSSACQQWRPTRNRLYREDGPRIVLSCYWWSAPLWTTVSALSPERPRPGKLLL